VKEDVDGQKMMHSIHSFANTNTAAGRVDGCRKGLKARWDQ